MWSVILTGVCYLALAFFILSTWGAVLVMTGRLCRLVETLEKSEALLKDIRAAIRSMDKTVGRRRN